MSMAASPVVCNQHSLKFGMNMKAVVIHSPLDIRIDEIPEQTVGAHDVKVKVVAGGICGSDLHYYRHGGFGAARIREPMILGHELAGTIVEMGTEISHLAVGQTVAVNPSHPCGQCHYCLQGRRNLCLDMRFYGSAMRFPHVQGGFRQFIVCNAEQAVPVGADVSAAEAAFAEPLAVALHAVNQAGSLVGRNVLVTGAGPIGILTVAVARYAGARSITATDVLDGPLSIARSVGADRVLNVARDADALKGGDFDVMFEAAGSAKTIAQGLEVVARGGTIVQIGQGAEATLQMSQIVTRELTLKGAFRFDGEFALAVDLIGQRRINVAALLTDTFDVADAVQAFEVATDKERSMKVQLAF
jgi:L-idonate 5-dehydrogenase